ncbi:hypothetical protein PCE1_002248 [Barthelona sp. PCE]
MDLFEPTTNRDKTRLSEALSMYDKQNYQQGLKETRKLIKKYPNEGELLCLEALFLESLHKVDEALEIGRKGLRGAMKSAFAWKTMGIIFRTARDIPQSQTSFNRYIKMAEANSSGIPLFVRSKMFENALSLQDYQNAFEIARILFMQNPRHFVNRLRFFVVCYLMGAYTDALDHLRAIDDIKVNDEKAFQRMVPNSYEQLTYLKALCYYGMGECATALELITENFENFRDTVAIKKLLIKIYEKMNDENSVIRMENELLQYNIHSAESILTCLNRKEEEEKVGFLMELVEAGSLSAELQLIELLFKQGEKEKAKQTLVSLLNRRKRAFNLLECCVEFEFFKCSELMHEAVDAIEHEKKAFHHVKLLRLTETITADDLDVDFHDPFELMFVAECYSYLGQNDRAIEYGCRAVASDVNDRCLSNILAKIYIRAGMLEESVVELTKFSCRKDFLVQNEVMWYIDELIQFAQVSQIHVLAYRWICVKLEIMTRCLFTETDFHGWALTTNLHNITGYIELLQKHKGVRFSAAFLDQINQARVTLRDIKLDLDGAMEQCTVFADENGEFIRNPPLQSRKDDQKIKREVVDSDFFGLAFLSGLKLGAEQRRLNGLEKLMKKYCHEDLKDYEGDTAWKE